MELTRKIMLIALIGLFSQFSMADNASSAKEIADIVASLNHFPSDADKAALMAISADDSLSEGVRAMATAVANFDKFVRSFNSVQNAKLLKSMGELQSQIQATQLNQEIIELKQRQQGCQKNQG